MPRPSHSSRFDHPYNFVWGVQIINSLLCTFLQSSGTSSILGPNILLNILFPNILSQHSSLNVGNHVLHP
jgi:hypothetical protein